MLRGQEDTADLTFRDMQGKGIFDPRPLIDRFPAQKIDYQAYHHATRTAIIELTGERPTQEDRVLVNALPYLLCMSSAEIQSAIRETIHALTAEIEEVGLMDGSTLCATFLCGDTVYNANVGDSESFLVVRDKNNNIVSFERLNTVLHGIEVENVERLRSEGITIPEPPPEFEGDYRLPLPDGGPGVNLYRAMGDTIFELAGLSHVPDISMKKVLIPEDGHAFVINACDGLTEQMDDDLRTELREWIQNHKQFLLLDLAKALAKCAISSHSQDNISVIITPLEHFGVAKYMAVFDGHGGSSVSRFLSHTFHEMLIKKCEEQSSLKWLSQEQKSELMQRLTKVTELKNDIVRLNPEVNLGTIFDKIDESFLIQVLEDEKSENKPGLIMQHWSQQEALLSAARQAFKIPKTISFDVSLFMEFKSNIDLNKVQDSAILLEKQVKAAFIAFEEKGTKDRETFIAFTTASLNQAIEKSLEFARQTKSDSHREVDLHLFTQVIPKKLKGRPQYQTLISEMKEADVSDTVSTTALEKTVTKLLISIYLEVYKTNFDRVLLSTLFSSTKNDLISWLEEVIVWRFPVFIRKRAPDNAINVLQNRILRFTGENFPELVSKILLDLTALKNDLEDSKPIENSRALFINTAKLLSCLGKKGADAATEFFALIPQRAVADSDIKKYYDDLILNRGIPRFTSVAKSGMPRPSVTRSTDD